VVLVKVVGGRKFERWVEDVGEDVEEQLRHMTSM
jgi:hypothetical protein